MGKIHPEDSPSGTEPPHPGTPALHGRLRGRGLPSEAASGQLEESPHPTIVLPSPLTTSSPDPTSHPLPSPVPRS